MAKKKTKTKVKKAVKKVAKKKASREIDVLKECVTALGTRLSKLITALQTSKTIKGI